MNRLPRTYTPIIRSALLAVLLSALPLFASCANDAYNRLPFAVPFPMGKAGAKATAEFRVTEGERYAATLQYEYKQNDEADRARVWRLAGGSVQDGPGKWKETGAPLQIRVSVKRMGVGDTGQVVEKIVENPRLSSWGATLKATLLEVSLDPGVYMVMAESLHDAPSFEGARTNLLIGRAHRGK